MHARSLITRRSDHPLVIAHRGLAWSYPENTLASFDAAIDAGADLIELDFQTTADGQLVCVHDLKLRRYLAGTHDADLLDRAIGVFTREELRAFDVGSWKSPQYAGATIPTLAEALTHCARAELLIERKTGSPAQTLASIDACGARDRVIVQAFDWDYLADLRGLAPDLPRVALGGGAIGDRIERLAATGSAAVHWNDQLTRRDITTLHEMGLPVWMYTLNSELTWHGALALQIDGITTDRADAATTFLQRHCPRPIPG